MDQKKLKDLPDSPGVYLMKNKRGEVIYIGKAASIKKRVSSYFRRGGKSPRTELLVSRIEKVDFIPTHSEAAALIWEASMIKNLHPRYNIELKDDKSYPYLKLTNELFPRLMVTRRRKPGGARYFGPYTNVKLLRQALKFMRKIFPLRSCNRLPKKVCLLYHIDECLGPCERKVSKAEYKRTVKELILFLEGRRKELIKHLSLCMQESSKKMNYELAVRIRDKINALSVATEGGVGAYCNTPLLQIEELRHVLHLRRRLHRIEAFDISNISGKEAVGSLVVFINGGPKKSEYRRFRIKTVEGINDYAMMREVVRRRYRRVLDEKLPLPDLIIIDGGKGHLSEGRRVLEELGISNRPIIGIAKEFERIWLPKADIPLMLHKNSPVLHLVQRIRNEAHRFAHAYHRILRRKKIIG